MDAELAVHTIKESCYRVGYPIQSYEEFKRRKLINKSCDYAIECIEKIQEFKSIVEQVDTKNPEIAIGDREGIRKIKEILENTNKEQDAYNMVKAMSNADNQLRYDEYLRILKEGKIFSKMTNIELTSDMVVKKIVEENEMLLNMNKSLKEENKILRQVCDVEILPMEEAAIELGQGTVYSTYDWYNTLNQFKNLGLSVCKVKGAKDE